MPQKSFILSKIKTRNLIVYYFILLVIGIIISSFALLHESIKWTNQLTISTIAILGGFGSALLGSTIFYLRKLYKASLNNELSNPQNEADYFKQLGIFSYYFFRPVFSLVFSLLIHIVLKSSVHIVTVNETKLGEGFIYLLMFLSFFGGFASGDLLDFIDLKRKTWITKPFNKL